jgi:molybdate-binding protein
LGLVEEIKARTRLVRSGTEVAETVAKGEAEIGIGVASDAVIVPGLEAIPLPSGAQSYSLKSMPTRTAASKTPRFRRTHPCGQLEDRHGAEHGVAANDPHSCLSNSVA